VVEIKTPKILNKQYNKEKEIKTPMITSKQYKKEEEISKFTHQTINRFFTPFSHLNKTVNKPEYPTNPEINNMKEFITPTQVQQDNSFVQETSVLKFSIFNKKTNSGNKYTTKKDIAIYNIKEKYDNPIVLKPNERREESSVPVELMSEDLDMILQDQSIKVYTSNKKKNSYIDLTFDNPDYCESVKNSNPPTKINNIISNKKSNSPIRLSQSDEEKLNFDCLSQDESNDDDEIMLSPNFLKNLENDLNNSYSKHKNMQCESNNKKPIRNLSQSLIEKPVSSNKKLIKPLLEFNPKENIVIEIECDSYYWDEKDDLNPGIRKRKFSSLPKSNFLVEESFFQTKKHKY
jgi:hypothetical protein